MFEQLHFKYQSLVLAVEKITDSPLEGVFSCVYDKNLTTVEKISTAVKEPQDVVGCYIRELINMGLLNVKYKEFDKTKLGKKVHNFMKQIKIELEVR